MTALFSAAELIHEFSNIHRIITSWCSQAAGRDDRGRDFIFRGNVPIKSTAIPGIRWIPWDEKEKELVRQLGPLIPSIIRNSFGYSLRSSFLHFRKLLSSNVSPFERSPSVRFHSQTLDS